MEPKIKPLLERGAQNLDTIHPHPPRSPPPRYTHFARELPQVSGEWGERSATTSKPSYQSARLKILNLVSPAGCCRRNTSPAKGRRWHHERRWVGHKRRDLRGKKQRDRHQGRQGRGVQPRHGLWFGDEAGVKAKASEALEQPIGNNRIFERPVFQTATLGQPSRVDSFLGSQRKA